MSSSLAAKLARPISCEKSEKSIFSKNIACPRISWKISGSGVQVYKAV